MPSAVDPEIRPVFGQRVLVGVLLLGCLACAGPSSELAAQRPRGVPSARIIAQAMQGIELRRERLQAIRATGVISGQWGSARGEFAMALALVPPDHLRVDVVDPLAQTVGVLRFNGQQLSWQHGGTGVVQTFAPSAETMQRLVRVAITPAELSALLLGVLPADTPWTPDARGVLVSQDGAHELIIAGDTAEIAEYRVYRTPQRRRLNFAVTFDAYHAVGKVRLPFDIRFVGPKAALQVRYEDVEANVAVDAGVFVEVAL